MQKAFGNPPQKAFQDQEVIHTLVDEFGFQFSKGLKQHTITFVIFNKRSSDVTQEITQYNMKLLMKLETAYNIRIT